MLESIYGTSLRYLPSCSQINQHKHFNCFSRDYCNACLFGNDPTTWCGVDLNHTWLISESCLLLITDVFLPITWQTCYQSTSLFAFTFSTTHQCHVYGKRRVRDLNPRDFYIQTVFKTAPSTNRTHGKYSSVVELLYLKLLLPLLCTISCGLSTAYGKVRPCRKLAPTSWIEHEQHFCWIA